MAHVMSTPWSTDWHEEEEAALLPTKQRLDYDENHNH